MPFGDEADKFAVFHGRDLFAPVAAMLAPNARITVAGRVLERARTFSNRSPGAAFWYENSNGLAEIAVNQGARIASSVL